MKIHNFSMLVFVIISGILTECKARLKCPPVNLPNGSVKVRSRGRVAVYKCNRGFFMLGEGFAACIKGKWDENPPVCLRPGCPIIKYLANGNVYESWRSSLLKFTCNPGYTLIGPSYIYCNGKRWSAMQPYCKAVDIKCDFENKNACNWIIDEEDDDDEFNWHILQHEPPSRILRTGPLHDHTISPNDTGHYLLLETSDYTTSSRPARIHSPTFPKPVDNSSCFIFWYHMYGNTVGSLNVFINNDISFQRRGNHGDRWIKAVIPLKANSSSSEFQIMIEGTYGGGYTGDIALDDFSIGNGTDCSEARVTSCEGRCYEDQDDTASCLCNPECLVDSSCCKDFMDFCSIESTTYFVASSSVEDMVTEANTHSSGTTLPDFDTSFPDTTFRTLEIQSVSDLDQLYTYDLTDATEVEESSITYNSQNGRNETEEHNYTTGITSSFNDSLFEQHKTNDNFFLGFPSSQMSSDLYKNAKPNSTTEAYSMKENNFSITDPCDSCNREGYNDDTTVNTPNHDETNFVSDNINSTDFTSYNSSSTVLQTTEDIKGITIGSLLHKLLTSKTNSSELFSTVNLSRTEHISLPTESTYNNKSTIFKKYLSVNTDKPTERSHVTSVAPTLKNSQFTINDSDNSNRNDGISSHGFTPKVFFSSTRIELPPTQRISTEGTDILKSLSTTPIFSSNITKSATIIFIKKSTISNVSPLNKNTTKTLPLSTITYPPSSDIINVNYTKKKVNDSHTHLQTTPTLPFINVTSTKKAHLVNYTPHVTHITVTPFKKWKSIYRPKEKFSFSAVKRKKSSVNETIIGLMICITILIAVCALVIFIVKRRRFRLVNELEPDTDILYHSSQEMLDLHIARPNQQLLH